MIIEIEAYSLDEAIENFKEETKITIVPKIITINSTEIIQDFKPYQNLGLIFVYRNKKPGLNVNKIQTVVEDIVTTGEKIWVTKYLVVNEQDKVVSSKGIYKTKKEAIDFAREYTSSNQINTSVIIGKSANNFSRVQAKITYKPSIGQIRGLYTFIY